MKTNGQGESMLPTMRDLMTGPVILKSVDREHRQLRAAKLSGNTYLRLRLVTLDEPGDAEEWEEHRKTLGQGQVMCPECEVNGTDASDCEFCEGAGMVSRSKWDLWFFSTKGCRDYKPGCEAACRLHRCPYDAARSVQSSLVVVLDAASAGGSPKWKTRGNSLDGFRLEGLCGNVAALERYINLIVDSVGALSADEFEGEE